MKLADCVEYLSRGKSPDYVDKSDITVINQACIYWNGVNIEKAKYQNPNSIYKKAVLQDKDVLINSTGTGTLGRAAVYYNSGETAIADSHVTIVRTDKTKVVPEFLCLYLRRDIIQKELYSRCVSGSTNQVELSKDKLLAFPVPEIPIEVQHNIVTNLGKISNIIAIRNEELSALDNLIKARFAEMFGDPILNQKGFPVYKMDAVVEFQGGSQPDKKFFEYTPSENNVRLIQIRDYKTDNYITYIPKSMARRHCTADDIMIGRYGPPIFQILQGIEGSYNVALMKATPKMGNREFIRWFLKQECLLQYLEGLSKRTAGQDGIQMDKLKAYPVPMPPVELQDDFESFAEQICKTKSAIQKTLDETQLLFDSLMQEYFG